MPDSARQDGAAARLIASRLRMANNYLQDARTLNRSGSRTSSFCLFMAAETVLLAILAFRVVLQRVATLVSECAEWFAVHDLDVNSREPAGNIRPIRRPAGGA